MATSGIGRRRVAAKADASARYTERRKALVEAAAATFREKGFKEASLDEIARAADVDRASLYYYVASKKELFYAVVHEAVEANTLHAEQIAAQDAEPAAKLRDLTLTLMKSYEQNYPALSVFLQEDPGKVIAAGGAEGRKLLDLVHRFDTAVLSVVEEGIASKVFRADIPARLITNGLLGMVNWSHRWYRPSDTMSGTEIGAAFASLVCDGVLANPAIAEATPNATDG